MPLKSFALNLIMNHFFVKHSDPLIVHKCISKICLLSSLPYFISLANVRKKYKTAKFSILGICVQMD